MDLRCFDVTAPDKRHIRMRANTPGELAARLLSGYQIVGEVIGAHDDNTGGIALPVASRNHSGTLAGYLLAEHEEEFRAWLRKELLRGGTLYDTHQPKAPRMTDPMRPNRA